MSIRIAAAAFLLSFAAGIAPDIALAQANVMKECGAEYQAAKAANTLNNQKWNDFLAACRTRKSADKAAPATNVPAAPTTAAAPATGATAPAPAPGAAAPAPAPTSKASAAAKPASGGRAAMLERQKACGAEWKEKKAELRKADPGLKWPKYWSECNKRLKAAAAR